MRVKVVAPDGRDWTVRRLWFPRLRRRGDSRGDGALDGFWAGGYADDLATALVGVVAGLAIAVAVVFLLPYVFLVLELLVLPAVVLYRILFRKPWTIEARSDGERRTWKVVGWRDSRRAVGEIARAIERGATPASEWRAAPS